MMHHQAGEITRVPGRDLREGDVIVFLSSYHRVDRFEPYTGHLAELLGEGTRIAHSGRSWSMTIPPEPPVTILRRTKGGAAL